MAITVGSYAFDEGATSVRETYEAVGGKETRSIQLTGLLRGASSQIELEAALDSVLHASSAASPVYVSVRPGRRILARREEFTREINGRGLTGQFVLTMRGVETYEESEVAHQVPWSIFFSGDTIGLSSSGSAATCPVVTLAALGTILSPRLSDGVRTLAYDGIIEAGYTLVVDGAAGQVSLDGVNITPYTTGDFPQLAPGENVLTYADDPASSHLLDGAVVYRDRWW